VGSLPARCQREQATQATNGIDGDLDMLMLCSFARSLRNAEQDTDQGERPQGMAAFGFTLA